VNTLRNRLHCAVAPYRLDVFERLTDQTLLNAADLQLNSAYSSDRIQPRPKNQGLKASNSRPSLTRAKEKSTGLSRRASDLHPRCERGTEATPLGHSYLIWSRPKRLRGLFARLTSNAGC
jgi:hypothetical protein